MWLQGDYSCTRTSHEYWIMHMIFDRSNVTVCNVRVLLLPVRLVTGLYWMVGVLLVICRCTACSRPALTHRYWYARLIVSTNVLVCKQTVLSVVVAHKSAGVQTKLSLQALAVPQDGYGILIILHCGMFMTQLKFYNCHMKQSEIWLVLPTPGSRSQQFELG